MCLIVYKGAKEQHLSNKQFRAMINRNSDGLGIMYREDGRVKVEKTVGRNAEQFELYRKHRDRGSWAMHARFKTHGDINVDNCHPYKLMDIDDGDPIDLYMMHNGVLHNAPSIDKKMSDTWHYCEYILKPLVKQNIDLLWENEHVSNMIQDHIGKGNKFLFMRSDDVEYPVLILNHSSGIERNGMWLSNSYSIQLPHKPIHQPYKGTLYTPPAITTPKQDVAKEGHNRWQEDAEKEWFEKWGAANDDDSPALSAKEQEEFDALVKEEQIKKEEEEAKKDLPKKSEGGIILPLSRTIGTLMLPGIDPNQTHKEYLLTQLMQLRGLSDHSVREFIKEDPHNIAEIITELYDKNTMPETLILYKCKKVPDEIVRILRDMTIVHNEKMLG